MKVTDQNPELKVLTLLWLYHRRWLDLGATQHSLPSGSRGLPCFTLIESPCINRLLKSKELQEWKNLIMEHFYFIPGKEMATHSIILAWKIPWTEEPIRLQSVGLQRVGHD